MTVLRPLHRIPSHVLNGASVTVGIGLAHLAATALGGPGVALAATAGAVYGSVADLPNPPRRNVRRVLAAAVAGCLTTWIVGALRPHPTLLGIAVGVLGFAAAMLLAWGERGGPISFVPLLAYVFTMALAPDPDPGALLRHLGWTAAGAVLYLAWAALTSAGLQPRYRTLALAAALEGMVQRLRLRAAVLAAAPAQADAAASVRAWIAEEARLDERLQAARDLLFAAPDTPRAAHQIALLVLLVDLRDALLMGELDLDLIGADAPGTKVRASLAAVLHGVADELVAMHEALALGLELPARAHTEGIVNRLAPRSVFAEGDTRRRLMPVVALRVRHVVDDVIAMQRLMHGAPPTSPIARDALQLFVSAHGWPAAALRPHLRRRSPVLRHAMRTGLALVATYFIAHALLPWASYPHWLVLSVGVVLRGDLEQTLARRNQRIVGTALGCLLVLALVQLRVTWLSAVAFLVAAGAAHAFVKRRYALTAAAGAVMALLQAHIAQPLDEVPALERLADTVLGAGLAWAFSYVLPSWERHGVPRLVARLKRALRDLSREALRVPQPDDAEVPLRLARREVYDALGGLAAAAQRTQVEPRRVQLPPQAFDTLLSRSHALLAHLAAIRTTLSRHPSAFEPQATAEALDTAATHLLRCLPSPDDDAPIETADCAPPTPGAVPELPVQSPEDSMLPWLNRRLKMAMREGTRVAQAAAALEGRG